MQGNEKLFGMMRRVAWIAGFLALLAFFSTLAARAAGHIDPSARLVALEIEPSMARIHGTGETLQFAALGGYSDGTVRMLTTAVTWSSSDQNIAMVSNEVGSQGRVTSVSFGSVAIAANFKGLRAAVMLTVSPTWCAAPDGL